MQERERGGNGKKVKGGLEDEGGGGEGEREDAESYGGGGVNIRPK
jgi:hypothetical protein